MLRWLALPKNYICLDRTPEAFFSVQERVRWSFMPHFKHISFLLVMIIGYIDHLMSKLLRMEVKASQYNKPPFPLPTIRPYCTKFTTRCSPHTFDRGLIYCYWLVTCHNTWYGLSSLLWLGLGSSFQHSPWAYIAVYQHEVTCEFNYLLGLYPKEISDFLTTSFEEQQISHEHLFTTKTDIVFQLQHAQLVVHHL